MWRGGVGCVCVRTHTACVQTKVNKDTLKATDRVSIISLIDLAGSERQKGTGATGQRLKEGSAINQVCGSAHARASTRTHAHQHARVLTPLARSPCLLWAT